MEIRAVERFGCAGRGSPVCLPHMGAHLRKLFTIILLYSRLQFGATVSVVAALGDFCGFTLWREAGFSPRRKDSKERKERTHLQTVIRSGSIGAVFGAPP